MMSVLGHIIIEQLASGFLFRVIDNDFKNRHDMPSNMDYIEFLCTKYMLKGFKIKA